MNVGKGLWWSWLLLDVLWHLWWRLDGVGTHTREWDFWVAKVFVLSVLIGMLGIHWVVLRHGRETINFALHCLHEGIC